MSFKFSQRSLDRLIECEDDLMNVACLALKYTPYDFGITCGLRTIEEQKSLVKDGKSQTMKSRHLPNKNGLSEAIDIVIYVNGSVVWDIRYYRKVAQAFFRAAIELGVQIEWGGLWETFVDGPHFQLKDKK